MAEKDFDYNITQTFYAKWILPFVLILIGTLLILYFLPGMRFTTGKDYDTGKEKVFYKVTINGDERFVEVKEKNIYEIKKKGSYEYYYNTLTEYDKHIPSYNKARMNLSVIATTGGFGLTVTGIFMLVINVINKAAKGKGHNKNNINNDIDDEEDEEDDE